MRFCHLVLAASTLTACDVVGEERPFEPDAALHAEVTDVVSSAPDSADVPDDLPYLVSRFGPTTGLGGTRVRILTAFSPDGCIERGDCAVTIADMPVEIVDDRGLLEVRVPRFVMTGPLCVTWQQRTECGETFVALGAPEVRHMSPESSPAGVRDFVLTLRGEGFPDNAEVWFNWERLETTFVWPGDLQAVVPARLVATAGTFDVDVYAPEVSRCGARSTAMSFVVTD